MGAKRSAVDRVLDKLKAERAGIDASIKRIEDASAATVQQRTRRTKKPGAGAVAAAAPPTEGR